MNAIATIASPMSVPDMERLAVAIAKSGLFGMRTPEQALVLMAIAQAEGRHPVEAARDYDVIQGRPAKKAEAMLRDFIQAGGKVEWHSLTDELADATLTHPQTGSVRIDWDMKRAITAFGKKEMYTKFPRQMLRSRVVSEGVRTLWPLATSGMYVESEVAAMEQHNGPTLEASPERQAINDAVPLTPKQQRMRGVDATGKPWRSAEGEDADRAEAAERERAAAATTPRPERKVDPKVYDTAADPLDEPDGRRWMDNLTQLLANAQSQDEVVEIAGHASVGNATAKAPEAVKRRLTELLANAYARFAEPDLSDEALGEVAIAGMEKLASG